MIYPCLGVSQIEASFADAITLSEKAKFVPVVGARVDWSRSRLNRVFGACATESV